MHCMYPPPMCGPVDAEGTIHPALSVKSIRNPWGARPRQLMLSQLVKQTYPCRIQQWVHAQPKYTCMQRKVATDKRKGNISTQSCHSRKRGLWCGSQRHRHIVHAETAPWYKDYHLSILMQDWNKTALLVIKYFSGPATPGTCWQASTKDHITAHRLMAGVLYSSTCAA
jgi:hypothetical protein